MLHSKFNKFIFQNSKSPPLSIMFEQYLVPDIFLTTDSGVQKICSDNQFAFLGADYDIALAYHDLNCTLQLLDALWARPVGLYVPKQCAFREALNRWSVFLLKVFLK